MSKQNQKASSLESEADVVRSERRVFTRLTSLASWRSEYILRTRMLRSLGRGKPANTREFGLLHSSRSGPSHAGSAQLTYNSNLITTVNHLHATFDPTFSKRLPNFIHGADEAGSACLSDPKTGKVDNWGFADPQTFSQFTDDNLGDTMYGLGTGDIVGVPNIMDVSRAYGMVYAEGMPGGSTYYRSAEEKRGRTLADPVPGSWPELGIPDLSSSNSLPSTPCSVWIAKKINVPLHSEGLIGIFTGSSQGVVTSFSVGTSGLDERRIQRGEITARWVLSPGVPIIGFTVDEDVSERRLASHRVWAVALNALGELFYLTTMPKRVPIDRKKKLTDFVLERLAWKTGRTVYWNAVVPACRVARPDPFHDLDLDASHSPRSSWIGSKLTAHQMTAEIKEIQAFFSKSPKHFRKVNQGWDMRRRMHVDFAGGDGSDSGEHIIVIECGLDEEQVSFIRRYSRCNTAPAARAANYSEQDDQNHRDIQEPIQASLFNANTAWNIQDPSWSFQRVRSRSIASSNYTEDEAMNEEWRTSILSLGGQKGLQITASAVDLSTYALLTISEDPLLSSCGASLSSSPTSSPLAQMPRPCSSSDIPGQRARLLAVGTKTGIIFIWNIRDVVPSSSNAETTLRPVRIITTDSPQISCLALSALYLVHGGNDGLVQAWDPLASIVEPIRTINSRFSSRARRRIVQAESSPQGVGINLFAAGAILLDPDATVLRGMVTLGAHLRYWSYSSSAADQYKSNKRRLRRSERGSNQGPDRFSGSGRGALKDYIANEKLELERETAQQRKEEAWMAGRFGLDLLGPGATEDEILAYATMLSEEAATSDEQRRKSESNSSVGSFSNETTKIGSSPVESSDVPDADIAEAIKLSLQEHQRSSLKEQSLVEESSSSTSVTKPHNMIDSASSPLWELPTSSEENDLDLALRLSRAEEENRTLKQVIAEKRKGRAE